MKLNGKKILITGGLGYIGSRLYREIARLKKNNEVFVLDLKGGLDILSCPLPDVDYVFHLAAQAGAVPSMCDPVNDARQNILGTIRIARHYNNRARLIFVTSGAAVNPESAYGLSKETAERYTDLLHDDCIILRLSSVYGEKDKGVVDNFVRDKVPTIYGDGEAIRDFVHVDDIVKLLIKCTNWKAGYYECGSGHGTSVLQLAEATGKNVQFEPAREGEKECAVLENLTPSWEPTIDVIKYIKEKCEG